MSYIIRRKMQPHSLVVEIQTCFPEGPVYPQDLQGFAEKRYLTRKIWHILPYSQGSLLFQQTWLLYPVKCHVPFWGLCHIFITLMRFSSFIFISISPGGWWAAPWQDRPNWPLSQMCSSSHNSLKHNTRTVNTHVIKYRTSQQNKSPLVHSEYLGPCNP